MQPRTSSADAVRYVEDGFSSALRRSRELVQPVIPPSKTLWTVSTRSPGTRSPENSGDSPTKIRKINDAHISDRTNFDFVTYPEIDDGGASRATNGAALGIPIAYKPPGGDVAGRWVGIRIICIGRSLWEPDSELFTACCSE